MARLFTNYLRRVVVLSHLYFLYGVAFNFDGPFYVKGNKRFFTQRGDNSLFPESKNACT